MNNAENPNSAPAEQVDSVTATELVVGTSLWRDAWRRLFKNKLAVLGIIVVAVVVLASVIGPTVIQRATGYAYDVIPKDTRLNKSFAPFRSPEGGFSWPHPMGTDNAGRDILARVLSGGPICLVVDLIAPLVSPDIGVLHCTIARYVGGCI